MVPARKKTDVISPGIAAVVQSERRRIRKIIERFNDDIHVLDENKAKLVKKLQEIKVIETPDISTINSSIDKLNQYIKEKPAQKLKLSLYKPKSTDSFDAILKRNNLVIQFRNREVERKKKEEENKKQVRATLDQIATLLNQDKLDEAKKAITQIQTKIKNSYKHEIERLEKYKQKLNERERHILIQRQEAERRRREEEAQRIKAKEEKKEEEKQKEILLDKYRIEYLYHMTHKDNLDNILKNGLKSHNFARHNGLLKEDIANNEVNARRSRPEPIYGRSVHDYVPFYFNPQNPMLYVRRSLQNDIVILAVDRMVLYQKNSLFTDGNAAADATSFFNNIRDLNKLSWKCIFAQYWNDFGDGKRLRCSEILVFPDVSVQSIQKIYCNNSVTLQFVKSNVKDLSHIEAEISSDLYF